MDDKPLFFYPEILRSGDTITLPEGTAKHIGQVLRMAVGEALQLTDGQGMMADCRLEKVEKKHVAAHVTVVRVVPQQAPLLTLAIAFTKNASRNEWLLEKAAELGVGRIIPLITERSIRERIRPERWTTILTSAMLQSKQAWLPVLDAATPLPAAFSEAGAALFMAHCEEGRQRQPIGQALKKGQNAVIMIGPEGDFSPAEVSLAEATGATAISLGPNRLRTETAALAAITHFYLLNHASSD